MPNADTQLAQSIYLANMFAQKGTCQCKACQLLRQATDGMISQVLGGGGANPGAAMAEIAKGLGVTDPLSSLGDQGGT